MVTSIHLEARKTLRPSPSSAAGTFRCWTVHVQAKIVTAHVLMMFQVLRVVSGFCLLDTHANQRFALNPLDKRGCLVVPYQPTSGLAMISQLDSGPSALPLSATSFS
jgi:hypothetical protein